MRLGRGRRGLLALVAVALLWAGCGRSRRLATDAGAGGLDGGGDGPPRYTSVPPCDDPAIWTIETTFPVGATAIGDAAFCGWRTGLPLAGYPFLSRLGPGVAQGCIRAVDDAAGIAAGTTLAFTGGVDVFGGWPADPTYLVETRILLDDGTLTGSFVELRRVPATRVVTPPGDAAIAGYRMRAGPRGDVTVRYASGTSILEDGVEVRTAASPILAYDVSFDAGLEAWITDGAIHVSEVGSGEVFSVPNEGLGVPGASLEVVGGAVVLGLEEGCPDGRDPCLGVVALRWAGVPRRLVSVGNWRGVSPFDDAVFVPVGPRSSAGVTLIVKDGSWQVSPEGAMPDMLDVPAGSLGELFSSRAEPWDADDRVVASCALRDDGVLFGLRLDEAGRAFSHVGGWAFDPESVSRTGDVLAVAPVYAGPFGRPDAMLLLGTEGVTRGANRDAPPLFGPSELRWRDVFPERVVAARVHVSGAPGVYVALQVVAEDGAESIRVFEQTEAWCE